MPYLIYRGVNMKTVNFDWFVTGFGSVLNIMGCYQPMRFSDYKPHYLKNSHYSDLERIGDDIRKIINETEEKR
jgi:hypothetical protein